MTEGDVIDVLTQDHREVEQWFVEYDKLGGGGDHTATHEEKQRLVNNIIIELVRHAEAEEQFVYPRAKKVIPNGYHVIEQEISEHSEAEKIMNRLDGKSPADPEFDTLVHDLMRVIRAHVKEEEQGWFPQLRKASSAEDLAKLAERVEGAKLVAPTRPHPAAPDRPPFNVLAGAGAAVVDRARDLLTGRKQT